MSAPRFVVLCLVVLVVSCLALPIAFDDEGMEPSRLMYLLKRRDMTPPFELPPSLIQSMLKYRRY